MLIESKDEQIDGWMVLSPCCETWIDEYVSWGLSSQEGTARKIDSWDAGRFVGGTACLRPRT